MTVPRYGGGEGLLQMKGEHSQRQRHLGGGGGGSQEGKGLTKKDQLTKMAGL